MNKIIVTTTINAPTEAIRRYDALSDWHLVVATDRKTPEDYRLERGTVVTPAMQEDLDRELSDLIGWNCIQRRNFAFLWARKTGADIVAIVDDDNVPYDDWGKDVVVGRDVEANYFDCREVAFDPIGATNETALWHRGFPIDLVPRRDYSRRSRRVVRADVEESFWNDAADLDAICRILFAPKCTFDPSCFPIASNAFAPFSAANTFMSASVLRDYFLFPHVARLDDVLAGYYVQSRGHRVVFTRPTVFHERSPRDLKREMRDEMLGYEKGLEIVQALSEDPEHIHRYLPERSSRAFALYQRHFD